MLLTINEIKLFTPRCQELISAAITLLVVVGLRLKLYEKKMVTSLMRYLTAMVFKRQSILMLVSRFCCFSFIFRISLQLDKRFEITVL